MGARIIHGDCLSEVPKLDAQSIDAVICDPPYHLTVTRRWQGSSAPAQHRNFANLSRGFMSQTWDGADIAFRVETWAAMLRVLKPGAFLTAFGSPRTSHRMACAIEDAGFELCDTLLWLQHRTVHDAIYGDAWTIGTHRLGCGDATNPDHVAGLMGNRRATLCFTSPPYWQQRDYTRRISD